ncbi:MAG: membrane protein insertion efficiency factor YidD [Elusimicrobiota bacterium]
MIRTAVKICNSIVLSLITIYQKVSSIFPSVCRFYPSCSEYTKQAVTRYGILRGGLLGVKRICRCHPFNPGGNDPVPLTNHVCRNNKESVEHKNLWNAARY